MEVRRAATTLIRQSPQVLLVAFFLMSRNHYEMLRVSGRKCSCLHNNSRQNCCIFMWVKLWAAQDVSYTVVGLCRCRRFSMSRTGNVENNKKRKWSSLLLMWAVWVGVCTCQVRINRRHTKENRGGRMSPSLNLKTPLPRMLCTPVIGLFCVTVAPDGSPQSTEA